MAMAVKLARGKLIRSEEEERSIAVTLIFWRSKLTRFWVENVELLP